MPPPLNLPLCRSVAANPLYNLSLQPATGVPGLSVPSECRDRPLRLKAENVRTSSHDSPRGKHSQNTSLGCRCTPNFPINQHASPAVKLTAGAAERTRSGQPAAICYQFASSTPADGDGLWGGVSIWRLGGQGQQHRAPIKAPFIGH